MWCEYFISLPHISPSPFFFPSLSLSPHLASLLPPIPHRLPSLPPFLTCSLPPSPLTSLPSLRSSPLTSPHQAYHPAVCLSGGLPEGPHGRGDPEGRVEEEDDQTPSPGPLLQLLPCHTRLRHSPLIIRTAWGTEERGKVRRVCCDQDTFKLGHYNRAL